MAGAGGLARVRGRGRGRGLAQVAAGAVLARQGGAHGVLQDALERAGQGEGVR